MALDKYCGNLYAVVGFLLVIFSCMFAEGEKIERFLLEPGVYVTLRNGKDIFFECTPPSSHQAQQFFGKLLDKPEQWQKYNKLTTVAIRFKDIRPEVRREALFCLFPLDVVDESGWWHMVRFASSEYTETLDSLAEWLTGSPATVQHIRSHRANRNIREPLKRGDRILVPAPWLCPIMRQPRALPPLPESQSTTSPGARAQEVVDTRATSSADDEVTPGIAFPFVNGAAEGLLEYHEDKRGNCAVYRLRAGESLYSAVVVRFTDYRDNKDILEACAIIANRSGITNVHNIKPGQKILIPVEMLSDRFQPAGSVGRRLYEEIRVEEQRMKQNRARSGNLKGVVVIVDPGHGGRDHGAHNKELGLYEDEINYDVACRVKKLLETTTQAKVYVTVLDGHTSYSPTNVTCFYHDTGEVVTTTPPYANQDAKLSVHLRWLLANAIYTKERKAGVDDRKIVFISLHCDSLFNHTLRGAMIYVPGAQYREGEPPARALTFIKRFEEIRYAAPYTSTKEQRKRDEAVSRVFASTLLTAMRTHTPPLKVHDAGDPIRHVIRQSGGQAYLPAVIRFNAVPTKVMIEMANMTNPADQQRLADPKWRQWFAESLVRGIRNYYEE